MLTRKQIQKRYRTKHKKALKLAWKKYYENNKEDCLNKGYSWREKNRERFNALCYKSRLKQKYGMTLDQYKELKKEQNYRCAICKKKTKLVLDHCHKTNKVRGLLCTKHNNLLGLANDNIKILLESIKYLKKCLI